MSHLLDELNAAIAPPTAEEMGRECQRLQSDNEVLRRQRDDAQAQCATFAAQTDAFANERDRVLQQLRLRTTELQAAMEQANAAEQRSSEAWTAYEESMREKERLMAAYQPPDRLPLELEAARQVVAESRQEVLRLVTANEQQEVALREHAAAIAAVRADLSGELATALQQRDEAWHKLSAPRSPVEQTSAQMVSGCSGKTIGDLELENHNLFQDRARLEKQAQSQVALLDAKQQELTALQELLQAEQEHHGYYHGERTLTKTLQAVLAHKRSVVAATLQSVKAFQEDTLSFLRAFSLLLETVGEGYTHAEKAARLRGLVGLVETAARRLREKRFRDESRWSVSMVEDIYGSDYPVREFASRAHEAEARAERAEKELAQLVEQVRGEEPPSGLAVNDLDE